MSDTSQIYIATADLDLDQFVRVVTELFDIELFGVLDDYGEINFALSIDEFRVQGTLGTNNYFKGDGYSYLILIRYLSIEGDSIKDHSAYKESGNLIFRKLKEINKYQLLLKLNFGQVLDKFTPEPKK